MVSGVLLALFMAVVQLGLVLHVRNTLTAASADGARYAANADRSAADGAASAARVIAGSLGPEYARSVTGGHATVDGVPTVVVTTTVPVPVIGLWSPGGGLSMTVRGHAFDEGNG